MGIWKCLCKARAKRRVPLLDDSLVIKPRESLWDRVRKWGPLPELMLDPRVVGAVAAAVVAGLFGILYLFLPQPQPPRTEPDPRRAEPLPPLAARPPRVISAAICGVDGALTEAGYLIPPDLDFSFEDDASFQKEDVAALCGKLSLQEFEKSLRTISPNHITAVCSDRRMSVKIQTGLVVASQHPLAPHGVYATEIKVTDRDRQTCTKRLDFNYIIRPDFSDPNQVLSLDSDGFESVENSTALRITNKSKKPSPSEKPRERGFINRDLLQDFDFRQGFYVKGSFTMKCDDKSRLSSLDIAFCDQHGEKVAVLVPDGPSHTYSIKGAADKYGQPATKKLEESRRKECGIKTDGKTRNYFLIHVFRQPNKKLRFSLFVGRRPLNSDNERCVHERILDESALGEGLMRIRLKLWPSGSVELYDLEIGENFDPSRPPVIPEAWRVRAVPGSVEGAHLCAAPVSQRPVLSASLPH